MIDQGIAHAEYDLKSVVPWTPILCSQCKQGIARFYIIRTGFSDASLCRACGTKSIHATYHARKELGVDCEAIWKTNEKLKETIAKWEDPKRREKRISKKIKQINYFTMQDAKKNLLFIRLKPPSRCFKCGAPPSYNWYLSSSLKKGFCDSCLTKQLLAMNRDSGELDRISKKRIPEHIIKQYKTKQEPIPMTLIFSVMTNIANKGHSIKKAMEAGIGKGWFFERRRHSMARRSNE